MTDINILIKQYVGILLEMLCVYDRDETEGPNVYLTMSFKELHRIVSDVPLQVISDDSWQSLFNELRQPYIDIVINMADKLNKISTTKEVYTGACWLLEVLDDVLYKSNSDHVKGFFMESSFFFDPEYYTQDDLDDLELTKEQAFLCANFFDIKMLELRQAIAKQREIDDI